MPEQTDSKPVKFSCHAFRCLLVLYPKSHRQEYGGPMSQLFRDQCRDAWVAHRFLGLLALWLRTLPDLLKTSLVEHAANLNQITFMLKSFRPSFRPYSIFFRVFCAVFLFVVLASAVITFMLPETYRSTTRILVRYVLPTTSSNLNAMQSELVTLRSAAVREKVIQQLDLQETWGKKYNGGGPMTKSEADAMLAAHLEFQPVLNTDIVEISAFSDTPDEAAELANGVANACRALHHEVTIIDRAVPESRAVRPNKQLNTVLGGMMGVLLGLLVGTVAAGIFSGIKKNRPSTSYHPVS